ncbi:hypothetical protein OHD37_18095 [Escherichia coli]|nr:hypothetical protein [Escherichia coli]
MKPKIRGGTFVNDDFKKLIELLQTHIICTWDISSSVYHLTLKNLSDGGKEFEKYGNIAAAIFSELRDAAESGNRTNGDVELLDRFGNPIRKGYKVPGAKWGMAHLLVKHQMQSKHSWLRLYGWLIGQYFILSQLSTFKQILFISITSGVSTDIFKPKLSVWF